MVQCGVCRTKLVAEESIPTLLRHNSRYSFDGLVIVRPVGNVSYYHKYLKEDA